MSKLYVNTIYPQSGDEVALSGNLNVSGTINAYKFETIVHESTNYQGSNTFGNSADDVSTFTSQITASEGILIADDNKVHLGSNNDGSLYYNEDGDNYLVLSGSSAGVVLSGSNVVFSGSAIKIGGMEEEVATVAAQLTASFGIDVDAKAFFNADVLVVDDKKLYFGGDKDASIEYDEDGTNELRFAGAAVTFEQDVSFDEDMALGLTVADVVTANGQLTASAGISIPDDKRIKFGSDDDSFIEYAESGQNFLVISGSAAGVSISGSLILLDGVVKGGGSPLQVQDLVVQDDKKIYFGDGNDASIEYDEDGTDELRFAGAAVTFEQAVTFDANMTLGNAAADVITCTGQLTASEGVLIPDNEKLFLGTGAQSDMYFQNTGTTGSLSSSMAFEVYMADDVGESDGTNGAFIFKDSASEYLSFITRPGSERMAINKEFNAYSGTPITLGNMANVKLKVNDDSTSGSLSSSLPFEINLKDDAGENDGTHGALIIRDSSGEYLSFITTSDGRMAVSKEFNFYNDTPITLGNEANIKLKMNGAGTTGSLSSSVAFEVYMADDVGTQEGAGPAFTFKDSAGAYMSFFTRAGNEYIMMEKEVTAAAGVVFGQGQGDQKLSVNNGALSHGTGFHRLAVDVTVNKANSGDNTVAVQLHDQEDNPIKIPRYAMITHVAAVVKTATNLGTHAVNIQLSATSDTAADSSISSGTEILGAGVANTDSSESASASDIAMDDHKKVWMCRDTIRGGVLDSGDSYVYICNAGTGNGDTDPSSGALTVIIEYYGVD